jgi:hypothetical protein
VWKSFWNHLNFLWNYQENSSQSIWSISFYNWISLLLQAWWKEESIRETGSWLWCPWCCQQNWHHLNCSFLLILYVILWFKIYEWKSVNVFMILILLFKFYHLRYNHLSFLSCLSTLTHAYYITDISSKCHGLLSFHRSFIWSVGMVLCPSLAKCDGIGSSISSTMSPIHTVNLLLLLEHDGFQKRVQFVEGFRVVNSSWAASII